MFTYLKQFVTIVAIGACCPALSGCLIEAVSGSLVKVSGGYTATGTAGATFSSCDVLSPGDFSCTWIWPDGTFHSYEVVFNGAGDDESIIDPLILQVLDTATGISGTYDNGHGLRGPLLVTAGLKSVPIDANTNLVAEVGRQLAIIELPPGTPPGAYTYTFNVTETTPLVKALFAGKVQVGGKTYYPPLLPCVTDFASVPIFEWPSPGMPAAPLLTPAYLAQIHGCDHKVFNFGGGPPTPDLNQHGLTGSWFEAATSGQGVEVEMFANPTSGTGSTFVSWFTYDTVIGGAERQRWYTAQGAVVTGQPSAALTIYQNTGGNFDGPPITTAHPVGTATLSFDTCTSGQLSYNFTDGTGRTGTIPLTRLTQNVTCSTTASHPTNADFALSGNWFAPAKSGQGLTAEVNPISGAFFAAWYTYMPNGTTAGAAGQRWYTAQGTFTPGLRSIPVTIYETTGGMFDTPTPPGQKTVPVGTGTMAFQSCTAATFSYTFSGGTSAGLSSTINLSRVGPVPPGCAS